VLGAPFPGDDEALVDTCVDAEATAPDGVGHNQGCTVVKTRAPPRYLVAY
jgi:hypothetical protein